MTLTKVWKWVIGAGGGLATLSMLGGAVVWAGNTHYMTIEKHEEYRIAQEESEIEREARQLKRQIKRLELEGDDIDPKDKIFLEFLKQDLELLK